MGGRLPRAARARAGGDLPAGPQHRRRALQELDGSLVRVVGRGTFVRGHAGARPREFLGRLRDASPTDIMEVRLIMEPQAAALAAHRASTDDLAELETILRRSIAAKGTPDPDIWVAALDLAIFRATKNALLIDYCEAINAARNQPHWYRLKQKSMTETLRRQYDQEHSAVVAALLQRDAEAARRAAPPAPDARSRPPAGDRRLARHCAGARTIL